MAIHLRGERPGDGPAIDNVNCRAFASMDEAHIVDLMRAHWPLFDPRYSVTAWDGDDLVGHTLFTPARIRLLGRTVPALAVGPVAVIPERQKQGIAGLMLRYGHELGRREGFALAFLYGHPTYYPRHGYRPCFGWMQVDIQVDALPQPTRTFDVRPVQPADIPWLIDRQHAEWADVDFGWLWGDGLGGWTMPGLNARMWWTPDGRRAAYTVATAGRHKCDLLLADDPALARDVIATIRPAKMSHHPSGWLARCALDPSWATAKVEPRAAAMAVELQPGALELYGQAVEAKQRPPGAPLFPLPFLLG